ncbi:hypothetical protein L1987_25875 [Smallanthus sonchifolius]|uniref:Uncharacterized protein n=1 Tax=Smallanthus sonchifolius TaxID=185202 RepID=A0ACB9I9D6_9ASTR|nr:hypothetical protein L1987_25875 [Smallanthus sonchifolius]
MPIDHDHHHGVVIGALRVEVHVAILMRVYPNRIFKGGVLKDGSRDIMNRDTATVDWCTVDRLSNYCLELEPVGCTERVEKKMKERESRDEDEIREQKDEKTPGLKRVKKLDQTKVTQGTKKRRAITSYPNSALLFPKRTNQACYIK